MMGWFDRDKKKPENKDSEQEKEETKEEIKERADAEVQKSKILQLGRDIDAHAAILRAKALELRKEVERGIA